METLQFTKQRGNEECTERAEDIKQIGGKGLQTDGREPKGPDRRFSKCCKGTKSFH